MNIRKHTPFLALLVSGALICACSNQNLDFSGPVLASADSTNELRFDISFKLNKSAETYVAFWSKHNPEKRYFSQLSVQNTDHKLKLVGLKGGTDYQFQVIARGKENSRISETGEFTTAEFPINILHLRWEPEERTGLSGYILSQRRLVNGVIYMIDDDGDVVWYQPIPRQPKLSHWTSNQAILVLYGTASHRNSAGDHIVEYDLYGKERFHLDLSALDKPMEAHHEVRYDGNDQLVTLVYEFRNFDLSKIGGESEQTVMGDRIVRMDTTGQVLWEWSLFDYIDPLDDPELLQTAEDWSHANSLSIDSDGHYLISFRNFNQIWKIHRASGQVLWKLGRGGDFTLKEDDYFSGQHAFHKNSEGDYMVFDNGREKRQTRVLTFSIDESNKQAKVKLNIPIPEDLYSDRMGNAYLMDNNNLLICAPRTNSLVIMDREGTVLGRARVGIPDPYRAEFVSKLYPLDHVDD